jgi:arylsulfatase A-like enzyme
MIFRSSLFLILLFISACSCDQYVKKEPFKALNKQPNIILILTDDLGYKDVGFNGSDDILTPNIDKISMDGINFTSAYVTHPYCSPSRAGLLTGRYQQRFGHEHNVPYQPKNSELGTSLDEVTLSEKLKDAGYNTYAIGKWHLGDHKSFLPHNRGFDKWFGFSGGNMNYWGMPSKNGRMHIQRNDSIIKPSSLTYLTDDFTKEALKNIKENGDKPFFMFLSYNAPHSPDHTTLEYLEKTSHVEFGKRSVYGAMVAGIDKGVGQIDDLLLDLGIRKNTMIIFLSDNGGRLDSADNGPFRGHKGMLFEGGIRVPFVISWPERLPVGIKYNDPIISLDIFATCLAAAGQDIKNSDKLDGINLLPVLNNTNQQVLTRTLYWRVANGEEYAVRKGRYKLIKSAYKNKRILFDLEKDQMETNDISKEMPAIVSELSEHYKNWNNELMPPLWDDPHMENVVLEETNTKMIRKNSLSKKEQKHFE